jgi:hypothetical protein
VIVPNKVVNKIEILSQGGELVVQLVGVKIKHLTILSNDATFGNEEVAFQRKLCMECHE